MRKRILNILKKIKLSDFLIITLLIFLIPIIHFTYKSQKLYLEKKYFSTLTNWGSRSYYITFSNIDSKIAHTIKVGDEDKDQYGVLYAKLQNIFETTCSQDSECTVFASITLTGRETINDTRAFMHKGKVLTKSDNKIIFTTQNYSIEGTLFSIPEYDKTRSKQLTQLHLKVLFLEIPRSLLQSVKESDVELSPEGEISARIEKIYRTMKPNYELKVEGFGNYTFESESTESVNMEVSLMINADVDISKHQLLWRGIHLIGKNMTIPFCSHKYCLSGTLISLEEISPNLLPISP